MPIANHLPGVQNHLTDHLSRNFSLSHVSFPETSILQTIFVTRGIPTINLYAKRVTGNVTCSALEEASVQAPCPMPSISRWQVAPFYAFPLIPIIPQVILKLKVDWTKLILIALACPRYCWFSNFLVLSVQPPIPSSLSQPTHSESQPTLHPMLSSLHLTAWLLHG